MRARAVWILRGLWFLLPLTVGRAATEAISSAPHAVPLVATAGLWVAWAIVLVLAMVPLPITLTVIRTLVPGVLPLAVWAVVDLGRDADTTAVAWLGLIHAIAATAVAMNALVGDRFVDGGSYGDERRMLLRPPVAAAYVIAPAVWAATTAPLVAGPLLIANRSWIAGGVLSATAVVVAALGVRSLHQLAVRWAVFVPTGFVLHDHMVITEPVLFRRTAVERLGAAIEGTPARDLSNGAAGLLLECELADPAPLGLRAGSGAATLTEVRRFLFCPSRPGELLDEAERRNIATD